VAATTGAITEESIVARIERMPFGWWQLRARIIAGTATFFDGFDLIAIASALPVLVPQWHLKPAEIGLIASSGFVGQLIGALFFAWVAERYGRLKALTWSVALFSLTSLFCAAANGYWMLLIGRLIQGIGLGGEVPVAAVYINEWSGAEKRGRFFLLFQMIFGVGLSVSQLMSWWVVPHWGWRAMFVIGAIPALLAAALRFLLPESPRWLATKGRTKEADGIVTDVETFITARGTQLPPPRPVALVRQTGVTRLFELFEGRYLRRTLLVWALWFCAFFITYGTNSWLPTIFTTVYKLPLSEALLLGAANGIASLMAGFLVSFCIDIVGRRYWFVIAFLIGSLPLFAIGILGAPTAYLVFYLSALSYVFLGTMSTGTQLYTPELYPTRMRVLGTSCASVWARIGATIAPIAVGNILPGHGVGGVFIMFGGVAILGAIITGLFGVETKNRVLEDISP
jgi:putative MFS transporter